ncbi:MAG: hypothetical protein PHI14_01015 [Bacteroidales bacterium]|nr:hypothetical protein [Bacteroidales bacterium]
MKRIILLFIITFAISCNSYKNADSVPEKRYRKESIWDGIRIYKDADTFKNRHRYDFNNRYLDDTYLLCYFLSCTEIKDSIPPYLSNIKYILDDYKNAKLLFLEIKTIQEYIPQLEDKIPIFWEEYIKENNENFQNYLAGKYKCDSKYLYLIASEDEIIKIKSSIKDMSLNLAQYEYLFRNNTTLIKDTVMSRINFYYGEYDLSKLLPYEYEMRYYNSISKSLMNK